MVITEHDGLVEIQEFLNTTIAVAGQDETAQQLQEKAEILLNSLNFIGKKEFDEATSFIADALRNYLNSSADNRLFVIAEATNVYKADETRPETEPPKSNQFVLDSVLSNFSDAELTHYADRIQLNPNELNGPVESSRVIVLDDWTLSGSQIWQSVLARGDSIKPFLMAGHVEAHLVAATTNRIASGIPGLPVGIHAYYAANHTNNPIFRSSHGATITGSHSASDYGFSVELDTMERYLQSHGETKEIPMLANPVSTYRNMTIDSFPNISRLDQLQS